MPDWHLAELNVARLRQPLDHPDMAEFVASLDAVNALAESSPGFVWWLTDDAGQSSSYVRADEDPLVIINLAVWESPDALHDCVPDRPHRVPAATATSRDCSAALDGRKPYGTPFESGAVLVGEDEGSSPRAGADGLWAGWRRGGALRSSVRDERRAVGDNNRNWMAPRWEARSRQCYEASSVNARGQGADRSPPQ